MIVIFHIFTARITKRKALSFANFEAIERFSHTRILSKNITLLILRLLSITLIILSISGIGYTYYGKITNANFVIAIDASGSMLATDFYPNRLEVAKSTATDFVDKLPLQTKIGVISFSGASYIKIRPSNDIVQIKQAISSIDTALIAGTGIGEVIITSTNLLTSEGDDNSLILITDGQNNIGASIQEGVAYAKSHNIVINTIGIGTQEGGTFKNYNESIISKVNFRDLQYISEETNGKAYLASDTEDMNNAYIEIASLKEGTKNLDLSQYALIIGLLILILEWFLLSTKYRTIP